MNDPARAATLLAIFLTTFALTFREIFVYLLYLERVNTFWYVLGSFLLFWVLAFRIELAVAEIEAELWECRKRQRRQRQDLPIVRMNTEMKNNSLSLARDNKQIVPVSPAHAQALYKILRLRDWKITKEALKKAKGNDGKYYKNVDARYRLMMTNWHKWGWVDNWTGADDLRAGGGIYLSEKGQREIARRAGISLTSPTD